MKNIKNNVSKQQDMMMAEKYLDIAGVIMVALDKNGKITLINKKGCKFFGYKNRELIGQDWFSICLPKNQRDQVRKIFKKIINGQLKQSEYHENLVVTKNGNLRQVLWFNSILKDGNGKIIGTLSSGEDIGERKRAEENLLNSEDRFKNLSNLLPQTVFEMDKTGRLTFLNRSGFKILGYDKEDLDGRFSGLNFIAPKDRNRARKNILATKTRKKITSGEYLAIKKDGSTFPAMVYSNSESRSSSSLGVSGFLVDITDIKKIENRLEGTVAKDEALLSSIADGVIAIDRESKIILINDTARKLLGCSEKEALGEKWYRIIKQKDEKGAIIPFEKSEFEAVLAPRKTASVIPCCYEGKNKKIFPVARSISPVIIGGKVVGAINVFRDVATERELDKAKTDFVSLASHQLRTPLSAIKWTLEYIMKDLEFSDKQKEYLEDLYVSNERLIGLVNSLLDVTRIQAGKQVVNKKLVDISSLIRQVKETFKLKAASKNQTIKIVIGAGVKPAIFDPLLFGEAINNIINNAVNYGLEKTQIDVSVRPTDGHYLVAVHNFGPAIPGSDKNKVFSKFYRGKNAQNLSFTGSGLGLFIAKAAVEANGGSIWYKSAQKTGTTFYFTVPR